jgi:hypothetical protein
MARLTKSVALSAVIPSSEACSASTTRSLSLESTSYCPFEIAPLLSRMAPITRHAQRTIGNLDIASPRRLRDRFLHPSERHANCCARPNSRQFDQIFPLISFRLRREGLE